MRISFKIKVNLKKLSQCNEILTFNKLESNALL